MRYEPVRLSVVSVALLSGIAIPAFSQVGPTQDPSTQMHKEWELGSRTSGDLAKKDGNIDDARVLPYLQQLADRLTNSAGAASVRIQLTRSPKEYAVISQGGVVSLSSGMVAKTEDEAQLSGLIAHEFAHLTLRRQGLSSDGVCVLDPQAPSSSQDSRQVERQATLLAVSTLKAANYDPTSLLSLLGKLSYEHPAWSKAISSDDLLDLRARLESEALPKAGYQIDSSAFVQAHAVVVSMLPKAIDQPSFTARRD